MSGNTSAAKAIPRDSGLEVIAEENEFFFTEVPDFAHPETPGTPQEGVFVHIDDVQKFIVDCDKDNPRTPPLPPTPRKKEQSASAPKVLVSYVSSDDDSYETDLELDEDDRCNEDLTGKSKYTRTCADLGVTPISSFLESLQDKTINLRFYGLGVGSAKAISVPLETNATIEKLNLEGNGIECEGAKFLSRILKENLYIMELSFLPEKVLSENNLGNEGAAAICDLLLYNRCIAKLDLSGNQIDDSCAPHFRKVLAVNPVLKHLRLAHNSFEGAGAKCFKEALCDNESLELLDLNWNHFTSRGAAMLAEGLEENVGLKYFCMAMAGLGCPGSHTLGEVLRNNRTVLELDVSYCRIPADGVEHVAAGLRENDVLQVLKIGSNPFDGDRAMILLEAIEENDSSALRYLDLTHIFVKEDFVKLANKLQEQRGLTVQYEGVLASPPKRKHTVEEMVRFRLDPVGHLRRTMHQCSVAPSEVFHLNGPSKITKQQFTDTVKLAQLDLSSEQINILFSKVHIKGLIDIENLLDCLENPQEPQAGES